MENPIPTYSALVEYLKGSHPDLSYIHVVEPEVEGKRVGDVVHSNTFIHDLWSPRPLIRTGGFDKETALAAAQSKDVLVGFARNYLATVSCRCYVDSDHRSYQRSPTSCTG